MSEKPAFKDYKNCIKSPAQNEANENLDDDPINPSHYMSYYKDGIQCIDAIIAGLGIEYAKGFCLGNSMKYIWRCQSKGGNESLQKAIWYLNKYIELNQ